MQLEVSAMDEAAACLRGQEERARIKQDVPHRVPTHASFYTLTVYPHYSHQEERCGPVLPAFGEIKYQKIKNGIRQYLPG